MKEIETKFGLKQGTQDSWVGKGEVITDGDRTHAVRRGSRVGVDDVPAKVGNADEAAVLGNLPYIKLSYALGKDISYAEATRNSADRIEAYDKHYNKEIPDAIQKLRGTSNITRSSDALKDKMRSSIIGDDIDWVEQTRVAQEQERPLHNLYNSYKNGKNLPGFKVGWAGNAITSGLGAMIGVGQYLNAANQRLNNPNIYAPNQYESQGLATLAGLRDNPYQQLQAMQDVERRNRYALNQAGGLTGAQRYFANVAGGIGLQRNYADVLQKSNAQNNAYKAQWANAAINVGAANAQRMQAANQYRDEAYAKSHAAREQMKQIGMQNVLSNIQSYYANEFKRDQFNRMMDLYWQEIGGKPLSNKEIKNKVRFTAPSIRDFMATTVPKVKPKTVPLNPWLRMTPDELRKYAG